MSTSPSIPAKLNGKKVLIVGFGKSGQAAAQYLHAQGAKLIVSDQKNKSELADVIKSVAEYNIEFELGKHNPKTFASVDLILLSPGVPSNLEVLNEARQAGVPITNDIELAYPLIKAPIIAVTGTNGKTTTTALIADMLKNDGKNVFMGGNIGVPVFDLINQGLKPDVVVLELSSFQLEQIQKFAPHTAVFTNMEPDHLDRYHGGLQAYYAAKKKLIQNANPKMTLIANLDNDVTARLAFDYPGRFPGRTLNFTRKNPIQTHPELAEKFEGAYLARPRMVVKWDGKEETYDLMLTKLPGDHNKENMMAAALASTAFGCSKDAIQKTLHLFKGVAHRLEFVRKKDGVSFFNDSKATNVASVLRSLVSFPNSPLILIAGGRDKDQDFSPLIDLVHKRVKNLILVGEAKEKMNRIIGDYSETFLVGTFEEAVLLAYQKSRSGDVILLSPACASYDMFKSYEERGDYFKKLVSQL